MDMHIDIGKSKLRKIEADTVASTVRGLKSLACIIPLGPPGYASAFRVPHPPYAVHRLPQDWYRRHPDLA